MRKKHLTAVAGIMPALPLALAMGLTACVDNDYDLSGDIDMTITFGGDSLMVPGSSTEETTMDQILDVDIDNTGTLRIGKQDQWGMDEGDLYLYADNEEESNMSTLTTPSKVTVNGVTQKKDNELTFTNGTTTVSGISAGTLSMTNNDVDKALLEIDDAEITSTITISLSGSGITLDDGFDITFPSYWTLTGSGTGYEVNGNTVSLTQQTALPKTITVTATDIDFTHSDLSFTAGDPGSIEIKGDVTMSGSATSSSANGTLSSSIEIGKVTIERIYGIVDPDIDITVDPMTFNDVADVLQDEETNLDWYNPQVYLTVSNPTDMSINFSQIKFRSSLYHTQGTETHDLTIGTGQPGTTGNVEVDGGYPDGYMLCFSPSGATTDVDQDITIDGMVDLIRRIPDTMDVYDIEANAIQEKCWVDLGQSYDLNVRYQLIAPLSFGGDLTISYKDSLDGWHDSLKDIKEAGELQVQMTVVNKVPLDLTLEANLLDVEGNLIPSDEMTCEITFENAEGVVKAGSVENAVSTTVIATVTPLNHNDDSNRGDISNLDGMQLILTSTGGSETIVNQQQSIKLDNVKLTLLGGVTIDLN